MSASTDSVASLSKYNKVSVFNRVLLVTKSYSFISDAE